MFLGVIVAISLVTATLQSVTTNSPISTGSLGAKYNVLHIMIDDLRPELGFYGLANRHTPVMDALAAESIVFDRAYAQQAVCGPSRNSYMSGRRPDASQSWNFINHFREKHPDWTTIPGLFLKVGVHALASGKTYHPKLPPAYDGEKSWSKLSLPYRNPCWNTADFPNFKSADGGLPCVFCPADIAHYVFKANLTVVNEQCPLDALEDTQTVDHAIDLLKQAVSAKSPFYLAVGMHKPHIPFQASEADYAKHPLSSIQLPTNPLPSKNMPDIAIHFTDDEEHPNPWTPISNDGMKAARRGYYAAVTGMDRKLGKLIDELKTLGVENTTAIVVHSDHGWQLGEHGEWRKMTNFELATRVPMFIRAPWLTRGGGRSSALVELVDLLPTIADLAGIPLPSNETFDGVSLVPLLQQTVSTVKDAAFSQYPRRVKDPKRMWWENSIINVERHLFTHMGYSVRTVDWRYTEWVQFNGTTLLPVWSNVTARELYDHRNETIYPTNFDDGENENVAGDAQFTTVIQTLSQVVRKQFGNGNDTDVLFYEVNSV